MPLVQEKSVLDPRPEPKAGHPYLQSARLTFPLQGQRLSASMNQKIEKLLADLGLQIRPMPTKV